MIKMNTITYQRKVHAMHKPNKDYNDTLFHLFIDVTLLSLLKDTLFSLFYESHKSYGDGGIL